MEWIEWLKQLSTDEVIGWFEYMREWGPVPGIALPLIEALLPILPLVVILVANATAYGFILGFLFSWIGTTLGAMLVFWFFRYFGGKFSQAIQKRYPKSAAMFGWIERKGFTPLFIAYSLPFTPSALVNIVAGLSTIPARKFFISVAAGKAVLVFIVTLAGYDFASILHSPWKMAAIIGLFVALWWFSRKWEAHMANNRRSHDTNPSSEDG